MSIHYDKSVAEYEALPGLRQSTIKSVLANPAKWRHEQMYPKERKHFTVGSAVHAMLLDDVTPSTIDIDTWKNLDDEQRADHIATTTDVVHVQVEDWKTKAAQQARAAIIDCGRYPLSTPEYLQAQAMYRALAANPHVARHLAAGQTEVTVTGIDKSTFTETRLKARLDIVDVEARTIVEVKTTADANPKVFGAHAARFGYHIQDANYTNLMAHETGTDPDEWKFIFVLVEKGDPHTLKADGSRHSSYHGTSAVQLDAAARRRGREDIRHGIRRYLDAERTGSWAGYPTEIVQVSLPPRWN